MAAMTTASQHRAYASVEAPAEPTLIHDRNGGLAGVLQPPRLVVVTGPRAGTVVALGAGELTVGRGRDNDVVLPDISVSRRHAVLRPDGEEYLLVDQGSGNGTRVNGRGVDKIRLRGGDEIALGDSVLQFVGAGGTAVRSTAVAQERPEATAGVPLRGRGSVYAAIAATLLAATALGLWRRQEREPTARADQRAQVRAQSEVSRAQAVSSDTSAASAGDRFDPVPSAEPSRTDSAATKATPAVRPRPARRNSAASARQPASAELSRITDAYLAGDIASALDRARAARALRMLADLEHFSSAWREGVAGIEEGRLADAMSALERAESADRSLAGGREGPLGREVRKALSNLHTRVALAQTSEDQLATAAAHLRAAVAQDPGNEVAREQLQSTVARANDLYLSGYVAKDTDAEAARRAFRLVAEALPPADETAQKARRWLDRLDGKTAGED